MDSPIVDSKSVTLDATLSARSFCWEPACESFRLLRCLQINQTESKRNGEALETGRVIKVSKQIRTRDEI